MQGSFLRALLTLLLRPIRHAYTFTIKSVLYNFFYLQYKAVLFPRGVKITRVDHELDREIPFTPSWIGVYMDFSPFWMRSQAFLATTFGKDANPHIASFVHGIGELYAFAADVYRRNFSTTSRPFYLGKPGFVSIHLFDPHLMCIPSLHVMVVIMTYTRLRQVLSALGKEKEYTDEIEAARKRALDITESILYVKQHSINCIAAALYAMTRYDATLFPASEACNFTDRLLCNGPIPADVRSAIKSHILELYRNFLDAGTRSENWEQPLLDFLSQPDEYTLRHGKPL
jgi:hypothetical protein